MINTIEYLKKIASLDKTLFEISVDSQKNFIASLSNPEDDFDRSYKQYLCQNFFSPKWKIALMNILGAIFLPLIIIYFMINNLFISKIVHIDAVGDFLGMEEVLPEELNNKYKIDLEVWGKSSYCLNRNDVKFIRMILSRFLKDPFFCFKCIVKIAKYSSLNKKYSPEAIIVHNEYSFTSSILTSWCENMDIQHIDIMHGEKLYYIRDSFFRYSKCFVWNKHYVNLLSSMKADMQQFVISVPSLLKINIEEYKTEIDSVDYKYFLAVVTKEGIIKITDVIRKILASGHSIMVRPHPRYTDMELLREYVDSSLIENPKSVNIFKSISNTSNVIGMYSTVLSQAYYSNVNVIIDDYTNPEIYEKLQSMQYHLIYEKNIQLLSSILNNM